MSSRDMSSKMAPYQNKESSFKRSGKDKSEVDDLNKQIVDPQAKYDSILSHSIAVVQELTTSNLDVVIHDEKEATESIRKFQIRDLTDKLSAALAEKAELATTLASTTAELQRVRDEAKAQTTKNARLESFIASSVVQRGGGAANLHTMADPGNMTQDQTNVIQQLGSSTWSLTSPLRDVANSSVGDSETVAFAVETQREGADADQPMANQFSSEGENENATSGLEIQRESAAADQAAADQSSNETGNECAMQREGADADETMAYQSSSEGQRENVTLGLETQRENAAADQATTDQSNSVGGSNNGMPGLAIQQKGADVDQSMTDQSGGQSENVAPGLETQLERAVAEQATGDQSSNDGRSDCATPGVETQPEAADAVQKMADKSFSEGQSDNVTFGLETQRENAAADQATDDQSSNEEQSEYATPGFESQRECAESDQTMDDQSSSEGKCENATPGLEAERENVAADQATGDQSSSVVGVCAYATPSVGSQRACADADKELTDRPSSEGESEKESTKQEDAAADPNFKAERANLDTLTNESSSMGVFEEETPGLDIEQEDAFAESIGLESAHPEETFAVTESFIDEGYVGLNRESEEITLGVGIKQEDAFAKSIPLKNPISPLSVAAAESSNNDGCDGLTGAALEAEVALFDMVEKTSIKEKHPQLEQQNEKMPVQQLGESLSDTTNTQDTIAVADTTATKRSKLSEINNATNPTAVRAPPAADNSDPIKSAPSSTTQFDSAQNCEDSTTLLLSEPNALALKRRNPSLQSNTLHCNKKPRVLPNKKPGQPLQKVASCASYTTVPMNKPIIKVSTRISVPSQPAPLLQASRKRPPSTQITSVASSKSSSKSISKSSEPSTSSLSRLWPDPSDVIKAITRWQPPRAFVRKKRGKQTVEFHGPFQSQHKELSGQHNPLLPPPRDARNKRNRFKDASGIMDAIGYPVINEGLCLINAEYRDTKFHDGRWNRYTYLLKMTKLAELSPIFRSKSYFDDNLKMYEARFLVHGTNLPPSNPSELYCIYFPAWRACKLGLVAFDFPTTEKSRNEGKSALKLWLVVHHERDTNQTGWLSQPEFEKLLHPDKKGLIVKQNLMFTLMPCGSAANIVRQFEAIKGLPHLKPHLQRALFATSTLDSSKPAQVSTSATAPAKPRSLPTAIWRTLTETHNSYQLTSISRILTGNCKENISLIQGPPGTGKSSTIAGLVSALLSGKAPLAKQRQMGCLIHAANTTPQARNRILVCAATNQAVDSLAWKIKRESIGPSGEVGDFAMARFGSLPWEQSRDSTKHDKPKLLSEIDEFLYEINVDRRASDDMQNFDSDPDPQEEIEQKEAKRRKRTKIVGRGKLRSAILGNSNVILTTLSGAGSKAFIEAVGRDLNKKDSEFNAVIIDEACQASEPESLLPFKYNPTTVTLVGDPQQLPVLSLAGTTSYTKLFQRSLFERLQSLSFPTILLRNQYRMHRDIAAFPSDQFYQGKLITPDCVKSRPKPSWSCPCFPPICFWDTNGRNMTANPRGNGYTNKEEADFITRTILSTMADTFLKKSGADVTVGIISFYRDQVNLLNEQVARSPALKNARLKVKVATVDGFQGSECDIIILSCVRSHPHTRKGGPRQRQNRGNSIGFLNDYRRVNVALTRAKCSLWIVGNAEVLTKSDLWKKMIKQMDHKNVLHHRSKFGDLFGQCQLKASKESEIKS